MADQAKIQQNDYAYRVAVKEAQHDYDLEAQQKDYAWRLEKAEAAYTDAVRNQEEANLRTQTNFERATIAGQAAHSEAVARATEATRIANLRETQRYDKDVSTAYAAVSTLRLQTEEIMLQSEAATELADIEKMRAVQVSVEKASSAELNAAAFGSGRSTDRMIASLMAEGADQVSSINLKLELEDDLRNLQAVGYAQKAHVGVNTIREKVLQTLILPTYTAPAAPVYGTLPTYVAPVKQDDPLYIRPLEPNKESDFTYGDYVGQGAKGVQPTTTTAPATTAQPTTAPTVVTDPRGLSPEGLPYQPRTGTGGYDMAYGSNWINTQR